jgi:hypothetical protein
MKAVLAIVILPAALSVTKVGPCRCARSGAYCASTSERAPAAVPKVGQQAPCIMKVFGGKEQ